MPDDDPPKDLDPTLRPWDRQPGETEKGYASFIHYRDQTPPRRIAVTARSRGRAPKTIEEMARRWRWDVRVRAWDGNLDEERRLARIAAIREEERRKIVRAQTFQAAASLVAQEVLARYQADSKFLKKLSERDLIVLLGRSSQAFARGVEIERLVSGEPTARVEEIDGGTTDDARERGEKLAEALASLGVSLEEVERRAAEGAPLVASGGTPPAGESRESSKDRAEEEDEDE